ncbi:MAG: ribonuclease Z [Candidatus Micrarchaeota archaeon]|nr:ribonuclease Z [Candidatus Micrarchaeota archaeon]
MEIKVIMLGTSGSSPTKTRGLPSVAVIYEGEVLLFDCGEGTQTQMLKYGVNSARMKAMFISHAHGDHIIGIAGLVRTMALNGRKNPLTIFVPKGYESVIRPLLSFDRAMLGYDVDIKGIGTGKAYSGKGFEVSSFRLNHTVPTLGYAFKENDRRRFLKEKCAKLGIKGTMYSELERKGKIRIGKRAIRIEDVTVPKVGKKIVYATDTRPVAATVKASKGADLLIHESSYSDRERKLATERKHSTAAEVAGIAKRAGVRRLVLTHISARYKDSDVLEKEARKLFKNTAAATDGYIITV